MQIQVTITYTISDAGVPTIEKLVLTQPHTSHPERELFIAPDLFPTNHAGSHSPTEHVWPLLITRPFDPDASFETDPNGLYLYWLNEP